MKGVLRIVQYNWHYYAASLFALLAFGIVWHVGVASPQLRVILLILASAVLFWSVASLFTSYYVYDYSNVMGGIWIPSALPHPPLQWLNVHAGLDEFTKTLVRLFPDSEGSAVDIYNPLDMTEPSIARARHVYSAQKAAITAPEGILPFPDRSCDTLFLLLTAHELRKPARRVDLCREAARVMADGGQLLLAEHLRDWRNFLAFGPGCFHFHSRKEWMRVASEAGLFVDREGSVTPLVRWFLLKKAKP
jgi:SAM-dependent methyltransferase